MGNTSIQTQSYRAVDKDAGQSRSYIIPFALLCSLFFLWAVANNLNDILLPQFQQAFTLTNFQAGLIQSAFYFGYFIIPIPAGILMKKLSYKAGIITGLFLYALGAALFWPAAEIMNYTLFLVGLFIIAAGLGCLETAANPFVTVLGPESSGHFRLNLAQTFNSFGAIIAVVFGQSLILSNVPHQSQDVLDKMSPEQLSAYKHSLVLSVQTPYMIIVAIVLLVALLIMLTKFPALQSDNHSDAKQGSFSASLSRLARIRHWRWAVLAQFCYVGAQTACWSYLIRYAVEEIPGMTTPFPAELVANMLTAFGFTFDGTIIITISFLAIAKCFAVKVAKRCTDFNTGVSRNIAIQHVNATDRALIAVNHHRHVVALHHFKKAHHVAVRGFHSAAQAIIAIKRIGNGLFLQWCGRR